MQCRMREEWRRGVQRGVVREREDTWEERNFGKWQGTNASQKLWIRTSQQVEREVRYSSEQTGLQGESFFLPEIRTETIERAVRAASRPGRRPLWSHALCQCVGTSREKVVLISRLARDPRMGFALYLWGLGYKQCCW